MKVVALIKRRHSIASGTGWIVQHRWDSHGIVLLLGCSECGLFTPPWRPPFLAWRNGSWLHLSQSSKEHHVGSWKGGTPSHMWKEVHAVSGLPEGTGLQERES